MLNIFFFSADPGQPNQENAGHSFVITLSKCIKVDQSLPQDHHGFEINTGWIFTLCLSYYASLSCPNLFSFCKLL